MFAFSVACVFVSARFLIAGLPVLIFILLLLVARFLDLCVRGRQRGR